MHTHKMQKYVIISILSLSATLIFAQSIDDWVKNMRQPWTRKADTFIKEWLILGPFPNTDRTALDVDCLENAGGEAHVVPKEGITFTKDDGEIIKWQKHVSLGYMINLKNIFPDVPNEYVAAYAYTNIKRDKAGKSMLSLGSDDGVQVFVNGEEALKDFASRGVQKDQVQIEVSLQKGDNHILLKIEQGTGEWGFCVREIDAASNFFITKKDMHPSIDPKSNDDQLIVRTDNILVPNKDLPYVEIFVMAPGGKIMGKKSVTRGDKAVFKTKKWKETLYEIHLQTSTVMGDRIVQHLFWHKGDVLRIVNELLTAVPDGTGETENEMVHIVLANLIKDKLGDNFHEITESQLASIYSTLFEYLELKIPYGKIHAHGFYRLAYKHAIDGSPQFCRAYLPPNYDPKKSWPLVVYLHGYNPDNPLYHRWWSVDRRHDAVTDRYDVIRIEPHGRGNTSYLGMGDDDIINCINLAKAAFHVDEKHVLLTGESMGGGGTWHVGTRHPELFAALAPVYGGWDYHTFTPDSMLAKMDAIDIYFSEKQSSFAQADALMTLPVFVFHGDNDSSVNVNYSRYVVQMLQRWGYPIHYHEFPGYGHETIPYWDQLIPWFLDQELNAYPRHVRLRSAELRFASSYWVKAEARDKINEFMIANVQITGPNLIEVDSKNISKLILTPKDPMIDSKKSVRIIWNGKPIDVDFNVMDELVLVSSKYDNDVLKKTPEAEGPISDIFSTPFAVVVGTIYEDTLMTKLCKIKADDFVRYWDNWQHAKPRVFLDTEITDQQIKDFSLILLGGPKANLVTQKMAAALPVQLYEDNIILAGQNYEVKDGVVQFIYPHPKNKKRYVYVIAANSWQGMYFANTGNIMNLMDDYLIYDGRIPNRMAGRPLEKVQIVRGTFDSYWQFNVKYKQLGDKELREQCPLRKVKRDLTSYIEGGIQLSAEQLQAYAGDYQIPNGPIINVIVKDGKLIGRDPRNPFVELIPYADHKFFVMEDDLQITFIPDEKGNVNQCLLYQYGQTILANKIE